MRPHKATAALVMMAMLSGMAAGPASASVRSQRAEAHSATVRRGLRVRYAPKGLRGRLTASRRRGYYAPLVGDRGSGFGFYPLPWVYRVGAWRYRQRRAIEAQNAIRFAVASQAIYSYVFPSDDNRHGVFNPYDGYGTPFFAGYYGPAGDPGAERGPFGRPYGN